MNKSLIALIIVCLTVVIILGMLISSCQRTVVSTQAPAPAYQDDEDRDIDIDIHQKTKYITITPKHTVNPVATPVNSVKPTVKPIVVATKKPVAKVTKAPVSLVKKKK